MGLRQLSRTVQRVAVAVAAATLLLGCGSDDDSRPAVDTPAGGSTATPMSAATPPAGTSPAVPATIPAAPPDALGLTAVVDQFREDELAHQLQVRVTNTSATKVRVTSMQLDWPGFTMVAPNPRSDLLAPGQTLDVPIDYGTAVCAEDPPGAAEQPPGAPAVARATVVPGDSGPPVADAIPIADRLRIFDRIFPAECRDQRVAAFVDLRFAPSWTATTRDGAPALAGTLDATRRRPGPRIVLTRLDGSVLLVVHTATETQPAVLTMAPDAASATLPVVIVQSGNCSGHALTESKKTFVLPVWVAIGDDAALPYELVLDEAVRPSFTTMINTSCGVG